MNAKIEAFRQMSTIDQVGNIMLLVFTALVIVVCVSLVRDLAKEL